MRHPSDQTHEIIDAVLSGYRSGHFPMADLPRSKAVFRQARLASDDLSMALPSARAIRWYDVDPRAVLPLEPDGLHIPGGLRRHVRRPGLEFTSDACFARVIRACARPRQARPGEPTGGLWIDEQLARLYTLLHEHGHAHSIEAWRAGAEGEKATLVGGIYGVHIGSAFFAESMFCRPELGGTNASSVCLVLLFGHLLARGFSLLDVQVANPHTQRFGVIEIPAVEYLRRLEAAAAKDTSFGVLNVDEARSWAMRSD